MWVPGLMTGLAREAAHLAARQHIIQHLLGIVHTVLACDGHINIQGGQEWQGIPHMYLQSTVPQIFHPSGRAILKIR